MIKNYIPGIYKNSRFINSLYDVINDSFDQVEKIRLDYQNEFFIETAVLGLKF